MGIVPENNCVECALQFTSDIEAAIANNLIVLPPAEPNIVGFLADTLEAVVDLLGCLLAIDDPDPGCIECLIALLNSLVAAVQQLLAGNVAGALLTITTAISTLLTCLDIGPLQAQQIQNRFNQLVQQVQNN